MTFDHSRKRSTVVSLLGEKLFKTSLSVKSSPDENLTLLKLTILSNC